MPQDQPKGYLAKYGAQLMDAGYRIIPIKPGTKRPPMKEWSKIRSTSANYQHWIGNGFADYGVGINTTKSPAADLDILDPEALKYMQDYILGKYGPAPVRQGMAPKVLLAFATDEPFEKVMSKDWVDPFCTTLDKHGDIQSYRVEILGSGQQYVAYHTHPDTLEPYRWIANGSIRKIAWADLPRITRADAEDMCAEFNRYAEAEGWTLKTGKSISRLPVKSQVGRIDRDDVFANDKQKTDISLEDLTRKLMLIDADEHDMWVQIGMALYFEFDGGQDGLDLWHEWSATSTKYDSAVLDDRWPSFDHAGKSQTPMTARIIIKLADEREEIIKVEQYEDILRKIAEAPSDIALKTVLAECKKIEFDTIQIERIAGAIQDTAKRFNLKLTLPTIRKLIRYEKPPMTEMPKWLDGFVYLTLDGTFYHSKKFSAQSKDVFNDVHGRHLLTKVEKAEGKAVPETAPSSFALNIAEIKVLFNKLYYPGEELFFDYNGQPVVNCYDARLIPEMPEKYSKAERMSIKAIEDHVNLLFPLENCLLDAIAWIVQNPGRHLNWSIMLQGQEGDGKSFFAGLLKAVLGPNNVTTIPAKALESQFNAFSEGSQVVFVEEMRQQGHNAFDVLNAVKTLITNATATIRRMQTDHYEVPNMTTYFVTSNYKDALLLTENDTRYYPLFSLFQTLEAHEAFMAQRPGYYARLFATFEHAGALRKWLLERSLPAGFGEGTRAPRSPYKAEMISYTENEFSTILRQILTGKGKLDSELLSTADLYDRLSDFDYDVPPPRLMGKLLMENGFTKLGQMRDGEKRAYFWSRNPGQFLDRTGKLDLMAVKRYKKGQEL